MSARVLFALLLFLSSAITGLLGLGTLLTPESMAEGFGVSADDLEGLDLLMAVLGGALVSLSAFTALAGIWSWKAKPEGRELGFVCAATLALVAVCALVFAGSTQVLLLDGVRAALLILLGVLWRPE